MKKRSGGWMVLLLAIGLAVLPMGAAAEDAPQAVGASAIEMNHASDVAAELGILLGDGQGVTETYLAKTATRLQGAILTLRLLGKEKEALAYKSAETFADASTAGSAVRPVLAYLKRHPELGWSGTGGGKFSPNEPITAQQAYKVMLESLAYRTGADFQYADTLSFAASKGLSQAAGAQPYTNRDLATALIETLRSVPKEGKSTLFDSLVEQKVLPADKADLLSGKAVNVRKTADGKTYLTDGAGMSLYLFAKDMADLNACTGPCLTNWPVFTADRLLLADGLNPQDFGSFTRADGTKQLTFKGWPLYYWAKDAKPGDVTGEGVGGVWYLVKQPFYNVALGHDPKLNAAYLVDGNGMSLYYFDKDPKGASVCADDCVKKWPVFHADDIVVPSGLNNEDFGEIIRPDGAKQTTFKGYPLYYWFQDAKRGDTKGHEVGKVWFLANPGSFAGTTTEQAIPGHATIEMKNYAFSTPEITVKAGSTVTFVNRDDEWHNAVSADGSFKIPLISQGQSVTIKLDKPGTYDYYCDPHKDHMKAKIIVQ